MSKELITKFGTVKENRDGHYVITSRKEGNKNKYLHRLVWEDFYGRPIPKGYSIHHLNSNKKDNRIQNLQCCDKRNHSRFHGKNLSDEARLKIKIGNTGKVLPFETREKISKANTGKKRSEETRKKMRENHARYWKGKKFSDEVKVKMSESNNTTGYYRVYIHKNSKLKQGFSYVYQYYDDDGKRRNLSSVSIDKLKEKVLAKGLEWIEMENIL